MDTANTAAIESVATRLRNWIIGDSLVGVSEKLKLIHFILGRDTRFASDYVHLFTIVGPRRSQNPDGAR
jgi:hypothetical protein